MKKNNKKVRDSIVTSCANITLPITLMLGIYVILHGHLSPGGGFQGGVLVAGSIAILYIAYGLEGVRKTFNPNIIKKSEDVGALGFVFLATLGVIYGYSFFQNVIHKQGALGQLYSSGTVFWMNFAVGYKVLAGIGFLIIVMLSCLRDDDTDDNKENNL